MESKISYFVMLSYFDGVLWNICFHLLAMNFLPMPYKNPQSPYLSMRLRNPKSSANHLH